MIKQITILTVLILLAGCSTVPGSSNSTLTEESVEQDEQQKQEETQDPVIKDARDPIPDDPFYAPIEPGQDATQITITGSLFNSESSHSLYSYVAPYTIGDSITVILKEDASASKSASSTLANSDTYALEPKACEDFLDRLDIALSKYSKHQIQRLGWIKNKAKYVQVLRLTEKPVISKEDWENELSR